MEIYLFLCPSHLPLVTSPQGKLLKLKWERMLILARKEIELVYPIYKVLVVDVSGANVVNPYSVRSNKVQVFNCKEVMPSTC
jgi:hypothetical protein